MAATTLTALDEAIALIDSLCGKLRSEADSGAAEPSAQVAPPLKQPWRALASTTMPEDKTPATTSAEAGAAPAAAAAPSAAAPVPQKQKKEKREKKQAPPPAVEHTEDLFGKAMLQVARVVKVEALPSSEKLYKTQVEVAGGETRQIIAGLRKHVEQPQLEGSLVVVILNLKAAKLAGELSEGMILAAVHADTAVPNGELVAPIRPPGEAEVGSRVYIEGTSLSEAPPKVLKSGPWGQIKELLRVEGGAATFDGKPLVTAAGPVAVAAGMPDGASIS